MAKGLQKDEDGVRGTPGDGGVRVRDAWRRARVLLAERRVDEADLEARVLLGHVLGANPAVVFLEPDRLLTPDQWRTLHRLTRERAEARRPLAYITGTREFMGLSFAVREGALIPRPETEVLVEATIRHSPPGMRLAADIGTGSGVIAVCLALALPSCRFYAIDISTAALSLARENAVRHGVEGRITFLQGDMFSPLAGMGLEGRLDLVVSNPPYVAREEWGELAPEIREHEPRLALYGGHDGLDFYRRLVPGATAFLRVPGGILFVELASPRAEAVRALVRACPGYGRVRLLRDYAGRERVLMAEAVSRDDPAGGDKGSKGGC